MTRNRKCILCETVCVSKQEMEEHIRSMLHHRELEKLKGRDCGHECRVCKVTVASLTDYAGHISSPTHKHNVEAAGRKDAAYDRDEDYFDQALVELIEKRKEQIRRDKEAAAAKLAEEEKERKRKEDFQKRLKELKERFRQDHALQSPSQGYSSNNCYSWHRGQQFNGGRGETRPWHPDRQGRSATWHAQEPPNLQKWASEEFFQRKNDHAGRSSSTWGHGGFPGGEQSRLPWLSSGGSSFGLYGQNNISNYARPQNLMGRAFPAPPRLFSQNFNRLPSACGDKGDHQDAGLHHGEVPSSESEHSNNKSSKTFGSNPKLDKGCRWSPYPVTSVPHSEAQPTTLEKHHKMAKLQKQDQPAEVRPQPEQRPGHLISSEEEIGRHQIKNTSKSKDKNVSNKGGIPQRDVSGPTSQNTVKPLPDMDWRKSSVPGLGSGAPQSKASSQALSQSKPTGKQLKTPPVGPLQSRQERHLPESLKTAKQAAVEKKGSLDSSANSRVKVTPLITEEPPADQGQSRVGVNKENNYGPSPVKPVPLKALKPDRVAPASTDIGQFLQSLQVSTSTTAQEDEGDMKRVEEQPCSLVPDEAMQVTEAGESSEGNTSGGGEPQTVSCSNASALSKLNLPSVFKRDLTKHISSKSKAGAHEPNLNHARRVRNHSGSRRSDTEKDSGIKPTVRQLISSSGSRRNVNWEQVYQEVRKKQDKGKGMPRFGIEMVPHEQEYQSQEEEDDMALLEGFQWESLMDASSQSTSRKRSLSESSLAPPSTHSLLSSFTSEETARGTGLGSQQRSTASPDCSSVQENQGRPCQPEAEAHRQPEKLTSVTVKALQRSDSVLGDSSSGTEQYDGQGTGKRRRAAGDVPGPEASCLEHNSKRRKVKSRRERLQIDQLLTVSLREEELSRSLQSVDTSLVKARATLEAAYMEVQRLIIVKQQMTVEMSTLRNKRIDLLKGIQGTNVEETPPVKLKEEKMDSFEAEPHAASSVTCSSSAAAAVSSSNHAADRALQPSPSLTPFTPLPIKEEPQSPVRVSSEQDPVDSAAHCAHSTTPELPASPAPVAHDPSLNFQTSPERKPDREEPSDRKEKFSALVETTEKGIQATGYCDNSVSDSKASVKLLSPSGIASEAAGSVDGADVQSPRAHLPLSMPTSPSETRSGKRVRKLKKRKALKKAQGTERPESSDTEGDEEASKPRWSRQRRRPSGGSQVSTSSLPADEREGDVNLEGSNKTAKTLSPAVNPEVGDQKSPEHMGELPQFAEPFETLDPEVSMDTTSAGQQPHVDAPPPHLVPDSSNPEPQRLTFNEVSSTSEMELCKSSESDLPFPVTFPKTTSDASSDHGEDENPTEGFFDGHQEAVNAMQIHNGLLYTCSGDRTIKAFDLVSHRCVAVFEGHGSKVTCLLVSTAPSLHHRLYSGSSDQTVRCYSLKTRELEQQFLVSDRVLCLHSRWKTLYAGLANGTVVTFNLKTNKQMDVFECHGPRAVSCLASSQEGGRRVLLVGSYDNTISVRAAKNGLLLRTLRGHAKSVLCMKVVNDLVFSGSSDHSVYAHNIHTGELVRVYRGHSHAVTVVAVLGKVMVTACLDKLVRVYDLQSQEQLQVYGGHKDMVLCMGIHKNMIYTGCYDGSVQAVKLNLTQSFRCWWHGCWLVFGMKEHLQQHLITDHGSPNLQALKCRWKKCEEFFCARNSSKQAVLLHMQRHAEEDTEAEH